MLISYSHSLIDFVPAPKTRNRLEYLSLEITQIQMDRAIRYLLNHSIKAQTPPLGLANRTLRILDARSTLRAFALLSSTLAFSLTGNLPALIFTNIVIGAEYYLSEKKKKRLMIITKKENYGLRLLKFTHRFCSNI